MAKTLPHVSPVGHDLQSPLAIMERMSVGRNVRQQPRSDCRRGSEESSDQRIAAAAVAKVAAEVVDGFRARA